MHNYRENSKMVVGDRVQFLEKCTSEFVEIAWAYYYYPYASPSKIAWQKNAFFSRYDKNNFFLYVFLFPIVTTGSSCNILGQQGK